jgi:hypothetical protein
MSIEDQYNDFYYKYTRRIERFKNLCKNEKIKKIFLRVCKVNENTSHILLQNCLDKYCINYEIKYIFIDNKVKYSSWKKDEINWNSYF